MFKSILTAGEDDFIIKKSRFIGYAKPVSSEEEALNFISEIKAMHKEARHNCSAYIIGEKGTTQRYSDDGEPSGTAGIPILSTMKKEEITNACIVVTRYFGGILLGAGGLVRAYTEGAKIALQSAVIVEMEEFNKVEITYEYSVHGSMENYLIRNNYYFQDFSFTDKVCVSLYVKLSDYTSFVEAVENMTSAKARIDVIDKLTMPVKDGKICVRGIK